MAAASTIAAVVVAAAAVASTAYTVTRPGPKTPKLLQPEIPSGPATIPDKLNFAKERGVDPFPTPAGVSFGQGLSDLQKRTQVATGGVADNSGLYRTPEVSSFYKDLAIRSLTDQQGNVTGSPTGVERQFATNVLGVQPRTGSTESFLSALLRA